MDIFGPAREPWGVQGFAMLEAVEMGSGSGLGFRVQDLQILWVISLGSYVKICT